MPDVDNTASPELKSHNIAFMYFHLLIDILLKMSANIDSSSKQDLINHLRRVNNEQSALKVIDEFEQNYKVENAIWCFDLYGLMKQYASEIVYDRVSPGFLLYQLGKYTKAKEYFQKILKEKHLTDSEKAHCYRGLGTVAAELYNFDEAHENFETELQIWLRLDDEDNIMETCKNIGNMLFYKGKYQEALDCLQTTGLYFRLKNNFMEYCRIYGMIAHITGAWQQWNDCLACYEVQLEARERELDPNHEDIGITHANIGVTYHCMGNYEEAVNHFRKALDIYRTSLSEDHPNVEKAKRNLHTSELELQKKNISEDHTDQSIR
ncbi:unnamed protein product [Rotaria sp. Silwood2]|nr:unnamed protein product [Rotaria sp. Silwood2]CAF4467274.1 unnamed protein product [Rotaria sp. Silwood2]